MTILRSALVACSAIIALALFGNGAWSQATRTIKIVVPFPPGGGGDILVRLLAEQVGRTRGLTTLIENRPGKR